MTDLDTTVRMYTEGQCEFEYYMCKGLSLCSHKALIRISGDFYKQFFEEQIAFVNYLRSLDTVYLKGSFNCKVVNEKNETIKHVKMSLGVCGL